MEGGTLFAFFFFKHKLCDMRGVVCLPSGPHPMSHGYKYSLFG